MGEKMSFHVPNQFRDSNYSSPSDGNSGLFWIIGPSARNNLKIIASDGGGWEHVSVSKKYECPTWNEMCKVKDLFWDERDCVVQFHPPKNEYVNNHPHCLHLWRPIGEQIKTPPTLLVGIK